MTASITLSAWIRKICTTCGAFTAAIRRAWGAIRTVLSSAFHFETQTNQFKTLIGNIDDAKAHMADLKALGDTPPFSLDEFAAASRQMMVMSDGVLGFKSPTQ